MWPPEYGTVTKVPFPVYSIAFTPAKPWVLVGGGGGASNQNGVPNAIAVYQFERAQGLTAKALFEYRFGPQADTCMAVAVHPTDKIVGAGVVEAPAGERGAGSPAKAGKEARRGSGSSPSRTGTSGSTAAHNVELLAIRKDEDDATGLVQRGALATTTAIDLERHYVKRLEFSGDGRLLLAGVADGSVAVWRYSHSASDVEAAFRFAHSGELQDADLCDLDPPLVATCTADVLRVHAVGGAERGVACEIELPTPLYRRNSPCVFRACRFVPVWRSSGAAGDALRHTARLLVFLNSALKSGPKRAHVVSFLIQQQPRSDGASDGAAPVHCVARELGTSRLLARQLISAVAVCPRGAVFAVAYADFSIELYAVDAPYRRLRRIAGAHSFVVTTLAFNQRGTVLASGSADGSFGLWDVPAALPRRRVPFAVLFLLATLLFALFLVAASVVWPDEAAVALQRSNLLLQRGRIVVTDAWLSAQQWYAGSFGGLGPSGGEL